MKARDAFAFGIRALRGHRLRSALSLGGVAIGVASVVLLTSLGEGARRYVTGEFANLGTNLLVVLPGKTETAGVTPFVTGAPHDLTLEDADAVARRVRSVRRLAPVSHGQAPASRGERRRDVVILGTTADFFAVRNLRLQTGRFLPSAEAGREQGVCVIGSTVRRELFGAENPLGQALGLGDERYRVIGVLAPRGMSIGLDMDEMVYVPVGRSLRMFNQSSLSRVLIEVRSRDEMAAAEEGVRRAIQERHDGEDDVTLLTQDSVLATFGRILALLTAALTGIAAISLTVAGIGIMNVMLVTVSERTREIGLLKAVGVTARQVVAVFLVEAALLSTAGGVVGLAAAFGGAALLRGLYPGFPAQPPHWAVAAAVLVSTGVGLIFGAAPARRAARLDPIAALAKR
ncbi:MAG: ABC transporter permease [Thermoanaerobaculia bacterium]